MREENNVGKGRQMYFPLYSSTYLKNLLYVPRKLTSFSTSIL